MPPTVVTLLPSATEIAYALGVEPAAVSHECDYPPAAAERPRASRCLLDPDGSSADIDDDVCAGDVYEIDTDVLDAVDPDVVITQGVCDVCAVDRALVEDALDDCACDPDVLTTDPRSLDDVLDDVARIGDALGREREAESLVADLTERIARVEERAFAAVAADGRPRTLAFDWMDPLMVAGHWVPEMVALAGGEYGIADPGAYSAPEDFADVAAFDPERVVVSPCGFDVAHARRELDVLRERDGWDDLSAVRDGEIYLLDGDVLNCPSPRLVDALETLAWLCHPDYFDGPTQAVERAPARPNA
ncbi:MAG: ABC transporter substrate-binding protein [Halarchaeum sp.]